MRSLQFEETQSQRRLDSRIRELGADEISTSRRNVSIVDAKDQNDLPLDFALRSSFQRVGSVGRSERSGVDVSREVAN